MIRVTQVDSEEELEQFSVWNDVFFFLKEKLNDTSIDVDLYSNKTCLKVELLEAGTTYHVVLFRRTSAPWWRLPRGQRGRDRASSYPEGQWGCSFLGKENAPAEGSVSSSIRPNPNLCFPGFDPKLFLVFFLGLLLFFCGDMLSRWVLSPVGSAALRRCSLWVCLCRAVKHLTRV